jgi:CheY-like chemotaxis protein
MMTLHLLILEDNPDDAELAVKELERKGFNVKWTRVDTEKAFRKALAKKPDLILVDYSLPSFDCPAALEVHRQLDLDIPLIIISGTIGEEVAVECMKSGATDCVFKDNLSRLGPVVKRALEEMKIYRKSKQAEEALWKSESRYKRLYFMVRLMCDNLPDLIWTKDLENRFIFANKACCEKLLNAKDTDEPVGKTDIYFAARERESHPENPEYHTFGETCTESDLAVMETEKPLRFDEFGNLKGKFIYLDVYKAPFWDKKSNLIGTVGCARDITREKQIEEDRKQSEEEKKKLEAQLRQSQKMEAIGTLAGSVAHDFNNILTTIIGNAELALMDVIKDESLRKGIEEIKKAGEKAASLTRQLLDFSRKQIVLPKMKGDAEPEEKEQTPVDVPGGFETVLIVEDDDNLRKFAQEVLLLHGYKVLDAENGEDALRVCKKHDGQIDLMIADVVMPKMSGREAAERLQPLYPQMKVIYVSGYTDNTIVHHGVLAPGLNFLEKPFTLEGLARKVREALDAEKNEHRTSNIER